MSWDLFFMNLVRGIVFMSLITILNGCGQEPAATPADTNTPLPSGTVLNEITISPTISPTPEALPSQITDDFGVPMALVSAGPFLMGSEDGMASESPIHTVSLDAFYIDVYEVTNFQYAQCVEAGECDPPVKFKSFSRESYYGNSTYDDYPVIYVTWSMGLAFCNWRDARLPTEAEWEKAARGGREGMKYPWGNEDPICIAGSSNGANFDDDDRCDGTDTNPVGSYNPNGYGLYDLAGNVWEWVADWFDLNYYNSSPSENPAGPSSGKNRILRGGSWFNHAFDMRVTVRLSSGPEFMSTNIGIRCARSP